MPLEVCDTQVAKSVQADCTNRPKAGFDEVGVGFKKNDFVIVTDATNPRIVTSITPKSGKKTFIIRDPKLFEGSGMEVNLESPYPNYTKNIMFGIPNIGAEASKDVVDPIVNDREGFVFILKRKSQVLDGGFPIIGLETGAKLSAGSRVDTDTATNGVLMVTMTESGATYSEVCLSSTTVGDTYDDVDALYQALIALAV